MNRIERFTKEASFTTSAQAISVVFIVGMIALFTTHASLPTGEVALVPAPAVAQQIAKVATAAPQMAAAKRDVAPPSKL